MPETTCPQQASKRFQRGRSGNPSGRPTGAHHAALLALDAIGAENANDIMHAMVAAAQDGDMKVADILLRRLWRGRNSRAGKWPLTRAGVG